MLISYHLSPIVTIFFLCITLRASNFENKDYNAPNEQSIRGESSYTVEDNAESVTRLQQDGGAGRSRSQGSRYRSYIGY